jgi:hypothetical protein
MIKKQSVRTLVLLLLIPVVLILGGMLSNLINPEVAAGHPNYSRNFYLLNSLKQFSLLASFACVGVLWILVCLLEIRSKHRSLVWLLMAALGPIGFAVLATLNDRASGETNQITHPYSLFVRKMNWLLRGVYELCSFWLIWELGYQVMVLKRNLMIWYQSATTGMSTAQIIDIQNASSGMWAFGEGMEVMYFVVLLYLLRPILYSLISRVVATMASPKAS